MQQRRRVIQIHYQQVQIAIIVVVAECPAATDLFLGKAPPNPSSYLDKRPPRILVEQVALGIAQSRRMLGDLGIDVTVDREEIEPAVVIIVKKSRAPAQVGPHRTA